MGIGRAASRLLSAGLLWFVAAAFADGLSYNPSLSSGNLGGWTDYTPVGGLSVSAMPVLMQFAVSDPAPAVSSPGPAMAAGAPAVPQFQSSGSPSGFAPAVSFSALSLAPAAASNGFAAASSPLIDFVPVAGYDFGNPDFGQIQPVAVNQQVLNQNMANSGMDYWGPWANTQVMPSQPSQPAQPVSTSSQYSATAPSQFAPPLDPLFPTPEPSTVGLFALGSACLFGLGRLLRVRTGRPGASLE